MGGNDIPFFLPCNFHSSVFHFLFVGPFGEGRDRYSLEKGNGGRGYEGGREGRKGVKGGKG